MSATLTARQQSIFDFIRDHIRKEGMPPTRAEISAAFGFASPNAAESHLRALAQKNVILLEPGSARGIRLAEPDEPDLGLPLIGRVAAGAPILAQEHVQRHYPVDANTFSPRADFLLLVRGMSMIDVGIFEGDLLAVHRQQQARNGQIVVARVDDDVTVKRLNQRADGIVELIAENRSYAPILVDPQRNEFCIEGIAVGLIRNLSS